MAAMTKAIRWRAERLWNRIERIFSNPFCKDGWGRWLIAKALNERTDVCWTRAAMWAMFDDFWDVRDLLPNSRWYLGVKTCRNEARKLGSCYCGKFASKRFAEGAGWKHAIIVTEQVEETDRPELTTFTFKG